MHCRRYPIGLHSHCKKVLINAGAIMRARLLHHFILHSGLSAQCSIFCWMEAGAFSFFFFSSSLFFSSLFSFFLTLQLLNAVHGNWVVQADRMRRHRGRDATDYRHGRMEGEGSEYGHTSANTPGVAFHRRISGSDGNPLISANMALGLYQLHVYRGFQSVIRSKRTTTTMLSLACVVHGL